MMTKSAERQDVLDLLARGKISIDEAVELLSRTYDSNQDEKNETPIFKAEVLDEQEYVAALKSEETTETAVAIDDEIGLREEAISNKESGKPRWLRIRVSKLDSGKGKVSVNVPYAMVRFGLGIARVFSPEINGTDLDEIDDMLSTAEHGLLVDVEDAESNEHVQIYLD